MKILSYCLMLFFAVVMVACTGTDTETIVKQTQCQDGTTVTGDETCPTVEMTDRDTTIPRDTTPSQETTTNDDDDDTNRGADGCFQLPSTNTDYTAGSGDEVICGTDVDNTISGGEGDDTIYGRGGNDTLFGNKHRDKLYGEAGNDTLIGGENLDILDGGNDTDTVDYREEELLPPDSSGNREVRGDALAVTVDLIAGTATDTYGDEDTLISIENVKGTSTKASPAENDDIKGDNNPNVIDGLTEITNGGQENQEVDDKLDGRGGIDTIIVTSTFNLATAQDASAGDPKIKNFENIEGRDNTNALTLTGDDKANTITGSDSGGTTLGDTINGAGGNDTLYGRRGNDKLIGGSGQDTLNGGPGNDCFVVDARGAAAGDYETITDFNKKKDAIITCGTETAGPDSETLVKISTSGRIERLITASVADDTSTADVEKAPAKYLHVATLSSNSTKLTRQEIEDIEEADTERIGLATLPNNVVFPCTCP